MAMASMSPTTLSYWSTRITDPNSPYQFNHPIPSSSSSQLKLFSSSFNPHQNLSSHSVNTRFPVCCNNNNDRGSSKLDNSSSDNDDEEEWNQGWDYAIQEAFKSAIKKFDGYLSSYFNRSKLKKSDDGDIERESKGNGDGEVEDWDWERWQKHFIDIDEQERIVSTLKSQLAKAVNKEDYEEAARLKVAIAAAATNDTVGQVMAYLNKAVKEERYGDAAALRDYAGTGLVGWWAGISEDADDPYGCIIRISAEYGRYVARSYSPRQLATAMEGAPLFEIFFTTNMKGEYKQQAVYLNRRKDPPNLSIPSPKVSSASSTFDSLGPTENKGDLLEESTEDTVDSGEDEDSSLENTLRDLIPGMKVKVLRVTTPGKVDRDLISKVVEQIIEEEDEEQDFDLESDDIEEDNNDEKGDEQNDIVLDANTGISDGDDQTQVAINVVLDGLVTTFPSSPRHGDLLRVPASLEKRNHMSFTFTVEGDNDKHMSSIDGKASSSKKAKVQSQRSADHVMLDLAKSIGKGKIPMKVLRDVGELINLTISQARNRQPLSGSTKFSRIDAPGTRDPLNGLYIGAHGLYSSEVIQLRRRFGQWKEDGRAKESPKLEFYEYVEATKITGDPYVPAGQIAFRAKIGKRYQLPHKGIIPEEFGVIARYKGEGRLAEPGFRNPRWVDGELVILDGKYIKAGPVVGFVYWAPEYQFLMFFNRLRLQM